MILLLADCSSKIVVCNVKKVIFDILFLENNNNNNNKDAVNGCWRWGEYSLPKVSSYSYLGIDFSSNGAWDMHNYKEVIG